MKNITKLNVESIKNTNYKIDFGDILSKSLENFQKVMWVNGAAILLFAIVLSGITVGLSLLIFGVDFFTEAVGDFRIVNFSAVQIIFTIVIGVLIAAVICPFNAGLLKVSHLAETKQPYEFSTVFDYYKSPFLKQLIVSGVIISLASSVITTLIDFAGLPFIGNFISYFIQFVTLFTIPFIIFGEMEATEAIEASFRFILKNFFVILLLILVSCIMAALGLIAICIGIFFTLPIIYSTQYVIYKNTVGINEQDGIDEIGMSSDY